MNLRKFVLMDGEPGAAGGAGGEGAGAGAAGGGAAGAAANAGAASGGAGASGEGGGGGASALAKPTPLHERIPEQFRVMKGEEFDTDASVGKVLESYQQLQARMRDGGAPPKAPEEYTIAVPDALKDTFKEDERTAAFRKDAHELGLNQKQFDGMMGKFFGLVPELAQNIMQDRADAVIASLDKVWGEKYQEHLDGAMKAFNAYADEGDKGKFDEIMRDPAIAYRILAKVSRELGEASAPPADAAGASEESVQALLTSEALSNPKHPEHAAARAKVDAYYAKKYGTAPVN